MNFLANLTVITMFFPWLSFGLLDLDTQPWFMVFSFFFIIFNLDKKVHPAVFLSVLLGLSAFFIGLIYFKVDYLYLRAIASYGSFFLVMYAFYIVRRYYHLSKWLIVICNVFWLSAGIIQVAFGKYVLSGLLHVRTTDDRGVTGLAPEPTFYGIFLFFISWIVYLERKRLGSMMSFLLVFSNLIFIVFVAKSSMVILYVFFAAFLYSIIYFFSFSRLLFFCCFVLFSFVSIYPFIESLTGNRVHSLFMMIYSDPLYVIRSDASINERVSHLFFSVRGFVNNLGFPQGFHLFSEALSEGRSELRDYFWWGSNTNKIMSTLGGLLFELGWFSMSFFISFFWLLFSKTFFRESLYFVCLLGGVLFSAIPISFPLVPMVIVSSYFYFREKRQLLQV